MTDRQSETGGIGLTSRRTFIAGTGAAGIAAVAGCSQLTGGDSENSIEASGSNTVRPLTEAVGEEFENEHDDAVVNVRGPGTGAGFEEFTQGDTDIQNASRDIAADEQDRADDNDIEFTRFAVGQDGLVVYLNPDNDFVDYLTVDELEAIYEFESEVETWSDVRSDWPDEEIDIWGRDSDSGTFDYFTEALTGEAGNVRTDYSARAETAAVVDGVAGSEYAIGFGGHSYYVENQDRVDAAAIQDRGEDEAYGPSDENITDGNYTPLTRPLFIFVNNESFERDVVYDFARFYFDNVQEIAPNAGFFGATQDELDENHDKLDEIAD
ncbi:PstS family phosphate ABC transporter substrate-binding protein [Natronorubrum sp. DTA7]|uniref:PstS family phosphate ABC transporter substrate-binding protein n=1 Tax=Natronorubrum sp. DTA7 TaxID=3447016 RepID=UPI003F829933